MSQLAPDIRNLFRSFIRLHILSFSAEREIYGQAITDRLEEYGYPISPGTLYPTLHDLEKRGLLRCRWALVEGKRRRYYRITHKGVVFLTHMKPFLAGLTELVLNTSLPEER